MTDPGAEMKARALQHVIDNRPAPPKCDYCGLEQSATVMDSGMMTNCPKSSKGHCYTITINQDYEGAEANRLAAFAAKEVARATAKVVCSFCGTVTEFDRTQEHGQIDAILAHINKCEKSPVLRLMDALQKIDELEAELLRATGKHQALVDSATEFAWQPLSQDWRPARTKLRKALEDLKK